MIDHEFVIDHPATDVTEASFHCCNGGVVIGIIVWVSTLTVYLFDRLKTFILFLICFLFWIFWILEFCNYKLKIWFSIKEVQFINQRSKLGHTAFTLCNVALEAHKATDAAMTLKKVLESFVFCSTVCLLCITSIAGFLLLILFPDWYVGHTDPDQREIN